jgi:hypothetical protein
VPVEMPRSSARHETLHRAYIASRPCISVGAPCNAVHVDVCLSPELYSLVTWRLGRGLHTSSADSGRLWGQIPNNNNLIKMFDDNTSLTTCPRLLSSPSLQVSEAKPLIKDEMVAAGQALLYSEPEKQVGGHRGCEQGGYVRTGRHPGRNHICASMADCTHGSEGLPGEVCGHHLLWHGRRQSLE